MSKSDLEIATEAAIGAGEILSEFWSNRDSLNISIKSPGDFVSQADLQAEEHLKKHLLGAGMNYGWLGEETGETSGFSKRWIVDPLDGTTNFLRGIPQWAVSVALEVEGQLVLGVVHDPIKEETFSAEIGNGATCNGVAIEVSKTEHLSSALFGTGIPFGEMNTIDKHAAEIASLMPHCAGVRRLGSAALDLAYVANGRFDGFWEHKLQIWDIAAGLVILREAGGMVTGWSKEEASEQHGNVISATPELFDDFFEIITRAN